MIRKSSITAAILFLIVALGCAATRNAQDSPLQTAEKQYVAASVAYEAAQNVIVAARANHQITDQAWATFMNVQRTIATESVTFSTLLNAWKATGTKPDGFDASLALLQGAATAAANIQTHTQSPPFSYSPGPSGVHQ